MKRVVLTMMLLTVKLFGTAALAQPTVITSIHPVYDLTRQIAGDHAEVVRVLPPGMSPHTFDPTPRDVARIAEADLVIMVGGYGIDGWLQGLVEASGSSAPVVELFEEIEFAAIETDHEHEHGEDEHHDDEHHDDEHHDDEHHDDEHHDDAHDDEHAHDHGPINSHIWLDPMLMVQAVPVIAAALAELDPDNAEAYRANGETLVTDLEVLDAELREMLASIAGEAFVPFHDAWPYFAERYGLDLIVEIEPFSGREPSPAYLRDALADIEGSGARAIFTEPQLSRRPAEVVAESAGLPLYTMYPLGGTAETETYQDLLRHNAQVLLEALAQDE
ncbi:N/A [soil metagenome]